MCRRAMAAAVRVRGKLEVGEEVADEGVLLVGIAPVLS